MNYHVDYYLNFVLVNVFKLSFCINCSLLTCTDVQCDRSYICNEIKHFLKYFISFIKDHKLPVSTNSFTSSGHSCLNKLAPVKLPSPPMTT